VSPRAKGFIDAGGGYASVIGFEARNPDLSAPELADASREKPAVVRGKRKEIGGMKVSSWDIRSISHSPALSRTNRGLKNRNERAIFCQTCREDTDVESDAIALLTKCADADLRCDRRRWPQRIGPTPPPALGSMTILRERRS